MIWICKILKIDHNVPWCTTHLSTKFYEKSFNNLLSYLAIILLTHTHTHKNQGKNMTFSVEEIWT